MKTVKPAILAAALLLCSLAIAQAPSKQQAVPSVVASWEPFFDFDGELYPSVVLAMSGRTFNAPKGKNYFGDALAFAEVRVRPTVANAQAHVEIQIEGVSQPSALDVTLPEAGVVYRIAPLLRYDYSRLAAIDQSVPATVTYSVKVNGSDLGQQTRPIRIRSVNDVPFARVRPDGKTEDLSFLFAGYVNESHPFVQTVLQKALQYHAVNAFLGYQRGSEEVRMQVFALWNVLQRDHIHYSSITTPSAASPTGHVYSQAVRFIDQSVDSQQANCVDGSVLFASLLYKVGIDPILVQKPGHMFVGYFLQEGHKQPEFLETTMLGAGHQPGSMNIAFSPVLHPVQGSESWRQFAQAVQVGTHTFEQEVLPALRDHKPGYLLIDVATARRVGINSIPHVPTSK